FVFVLHSSLSVPHPHSHSHRTTPTRPPGHDPPATTVRDRTPEALNALTSVAPSAASSLQQRRDLSSFAASAASRPQTINSSGNNRISTGIIFPYSAYR
ncbi:hypothetical protein S83_007479, partial [Arachis hypogaea]